MASHVPTARPEQDRPYRHQVSELRQNPAMDAIDPTKFPPPWAKPLSSDPRVRFGVRPGQGRPGHCTDKGGKLYRRPPCATEARHFVDIGCDPHRAAVAQAVGAAHAHAHAQHRHHTIQIDGHSAPAMAASQATDFPGLAPADALVDSRDGSTMRVRPSKPTCERLRGWGH